MEAIILAGGLGTRLRSVVNHVPKCMAPVSGRPFLYYLLTYLKREGVKRVILSLGYLHEVVEEWIEAEKPEFDVVYSVEDEPLGTGGAIKRALQYVKEKEAFVLNGDTFFDIDLQAFRRFHEYHGMPISLALKSMKTFDRYGNVEVDENGLVVAFQEKRWCDEGQINGGIYLLDRYCLSDESSLSFSFETKTLSSKIAMQMVNGYLCDGYFIDIGIPEDFERANEEFKFMR